MVSVKRRSFLKSVAALASASVSKPAIAQLMPEMRWRLTASWPKTLDVRYSSCEAFAKYVAEATDQKFQISIYAAGDIVPELFVLDATQNGAVEMGHTALQYYVGKDPTWALFAVVPFGMNARQQNAWFRGGGGQKMMDEFSRSSNVKCLLMGNTGCRMGGWFNVDVKSIDDLKGVKMRIDGMGSKVFAKMGGTSKEIPVAETYKALENGTVDAVEWGGPYDDEKLGFYKKAKYYHYPGWWAGGAIDHLVINLDRWNELPQTYQTILQAAAGAVHFEQTALYDARNPAALKRLIASGIQLRPFSLEIMEACLKATNELNAEESARNVNYKRILASFEQFRRDEYLWWQVAEYGFDSFMIRMLRKL